MTANIENIQFHSFTGHDNPDVVSVPLRDRNINDPLVIAWIGRMARNSNPQHSGSVIEVFAARALFLQDRLSAPEFDLPRFPGTAELGNPAKWIRFTDGADRIPYYRLGYVYQHGRFVGALEPRHRTTQVCISSVNSGIIVAADSDGEAVGGRRSFRLPFERYPVPEDAMATRMILASTGDGDQLLIPWWEIARYFFSGTSSMLHMIFSGLARDWPGWICNCNAGKTRWIDEQNRHLELWLRRRVPDADCLIAALIWHCPMYRAAARSIGNSLDGVFEKGGFPAMTWPIKNGHSVTCRGIPMVSRAGNRYFLVTEILTDDTEVPFEKFDLWRDNDGRKGRILVPKPRETGWKRSRGGLPTKPMPPGTPVSPAETPSSTKGPLRIANSLQCSAFTDPRQMKCVKPEKEEQKAIGIPPADPDAAWDADVSTSLTGAVDGELQRAIVSGQKEPRIDPSQLSRNTRAKETVGCAIDLLRNNNRSVQFSFRDISLAVHLDALLDGQQPATARMRKWLFPGGAYGRSRRAFLWQIGIDAPGVVRHFVVIEIEHWMPTESYYLACLRIDQDVPVADKDLNGVLVLCVQHCGCWSTLKVPPPLKLRKFRHIDSVPKIAPLHERLFEHIESVCGNGPVE